MIVEQFNLLLLTLGGLLLFLELASGILKIRLFLSEPIVALLSGMIVGPLVLNALDMNSWGNATLILEEVARLTLAITLIGIAFRLPDRFIMDNIKDIAVLLGVVLPLMWLFSGFLIYLIAGFPIWLSLLTGAVIAPTDPVVASAIVTGASAERNIPARLRHLISAESAANDALAFPFVMFGILFLRYAATMAIRDFVLRTLLWETAGAVVVGIGLGWIAGKLLLWTERRPDVERHSLVSVTLSLALASLGLVKILHMDGLLAVFAAGVTLNLVIGDAFKPEPERIQEVVKRFIDLPVFFLFGLVIPWQQWIALGWSAILLPSAVILLRRLPALLVTGRWIGQIKSFPDRLLAGWFGPIGVAAIYYATYAVRQTQHQNMWVVTSLVIFVSLVVYGISDVPLTSWYGRHAGARVTTGATDV
jgi:NhaP-type Na+/H+ or K+/H+ antiporter